MPVSLQEFLRQYRETRATTNRVSGTALFLARDVRRIPPCMGRTVFVNKIDRDTIPISPVVKDAPSGVSHDFHRTCRRAWELRDRHGFLEIVDIVSIPRNRGIREKAIF